MSSNFKNTITIIKSYKEFMMAVVFLNELPSFACEENVVEVQIEF